MVRKHMPGDEGRGGVGSWACSHTPRRNFCCRGLQVAGERRERLRALTVLSVPVTKTVALRSGNGVRIVPAPFSVRFWSPRALLGRPPFSVLAAWPVAVRAVAWLLLWAATGRTCWPATAFTAAPSDPGMRATCSEIILRQEVLKDGFHRDLLIKVKFGESIEDLQTCRLLIKQYIPTGLLVDPYELASLQERNITESEFPILKCWAQSEVAAPCALKNRDICQWNNMKYKSVYKNVTLQVPVGLTIHTSLVCSVTLLITILCSTLILVAVFKYGHFSL
ncbi:phosphatidylinositol-glycan biosynthesis class X protein [Otolemur garnettii]|uniref:phosphatidylinositol-glycan biosynthesis class X protein n=1 Tax=Otolemur garnettii TaxID=30611 RepID=UPI000C7F7304|nr:phosphatidylinositol-glycan biosynthesis class X protein [Otolemur garnettii]